MVDVREMRVTPGTETCSPTTVAESLNKSLQRLTDELARDGGTPPQHELRFSTTAHTSSVTASFVARSDTTYSEQLLTDLAGTRDTTTRDREPADRLAWERPVAEAVTDEEGGAEPEPETLDGDDRVLVRFEPIEADRTPGTLRVSSLPSGDGDSDLTVADVLRVIGNVSGDVLLRVHLEPVMRTNDTLIAGEGSVECDTESQADTDSPTAVGFRPSIDVVVRTGEDSVHAATQIAKAVQAVISIEGLVPVRYAPSDLPANSDIGDRAVRAHAKQVRQTVARMNACRGRPVDGAADSCGVICDAADVAGVYRIPCAGRLITAGVSVPRVDSSLTDLSSQARESLLANDGLQLGREPGKADLSIRLDSSVRPASEVVVTDDAVFRARLLAQRVLERREPEGTTIVLDTEGTLSSIFRAGDWGSADGVPVSVWDLHEYPPRLPLFPLRELGEADFTREQALDIVTTTHDALLDTSESAYRRAVPQDTIVPRMSAPVIRDLYQAAIDECAPIDDYTDLISELADESARRELAAYNSPRFGEIESTPSEAQTAVESACAPSETISDIMAPTQSVLSLLSEMPTGIVCLDASRFASQERARLVTLAFTRVLATAVMTTTDDLESPLTVVFDEISQYGVYDWMSPLRDAATAETHSAVDLVFGVELTDSGMLPRHQSLTGQSPMYTFAFAEASVSDDTVRRYTAKLPDTIRINASDLQTRSTREGIQSLHLAADVLPNTQRSVSLAIAHPPLPTVPDATTTGARGEPDVPSVLYQTRDAATETSDESTEAGAENTTADDVGVQARLSAAPVEEADTDADSAVPDGVVQTLDGPSCETCGRTYDARTIAEACHDDTTVTTRRQAAATVADHNVEFPAVAVLLTQGNVRDTVPTWVTAALDESTLSAACDALYPCVVDSDMLFDGRIRTFIAGLELARIGCLPGYSLADSMVTLRRGCLSDSEYAIDDLLTPSAATPFDGPVLRKSRFQGRRYYALTKQARHSDAVLGLGRQTGPILGTSLEYNQCAALGVADLRARADVEWVNTPATLAATGVDAFAGYTDQDKLHTVGTVVADDPLEHDTVAEYVVAQHDRMANTNANAVWITPNSAIAKATLDVLAEADAIDLSTTLADSQYSVSDLQQRFLGDATKGIDRLTTRAQLLQ